MSALGGHGPESLVGLKICWSQPWLLMTDKCRSKLSLWTRTSLSPRLAHLSPWEPMEEYRLNRETSAEPREWAAVNSDGCKFYSLQMINPAATSTRTIILLRYCVRLPCEEAKQFGGKMLDLFIFLIYLFIWKLKLQRQRARDHKIISQSRIQQEYSPFLHTSVWYLSLVYKMDYEEKCVVD